MSEVIKNKYGFYELLKKPTQEQLKKYYANKYYQEDHGTYSKQYSEEEFRYLTNKIKQKYSIIEDDYSLMTKPSLLDVGCGEGHALNFFKSKGWMVKGLDYSDFGVKQHNQALIEDFVAGDIYKNLNVLNNKGEKFDLIWLDNILEHVLDPLDLLEKCYSICHKNGFLIVEVPNDFSTTQLELKEQRIVEEYYWIAVPDHISYFNKNGLINLAEDANWQHFKTISDFPIEFNLFNPNANYKEDKAKGSGAHIQRVKIENLMHECSVDKTNKLYEVLADMGLGRQIITLLKKL